MSLFDSLGQQKQMSWADAMQQLRSNPAATLKKAGYTIPEGMASPQQIINHLLQTGQLQQAQYNQAMQMLRRR